jgi:phosphoribosyl 1,2-cyclic phosphodiesterase
VRVRFCGVRGSTPAPGTEFAGVGGHTSCLALSPGDGQAPSLVLDAGTGIRDITALLGRRAFVGTIVLTHLHWDHVQGLPFFAAADRDDARVRLLLPHQGTTESAEAVLGTAMSPPSFPIGPDGLRGEWTFGFVPEGTSEVDEFTVTAVEVPHKGGRTLGLRIDHDGTSLGYVPDHLPGGEQANHGSVIELLRGVELLVHDAQFIDDEREVAELYGHSTVSDAIAIARAADVGELVLFHHSPARTDAMLGRMLRELDPGAVRVSLAVQGTERTLEASSRCTSAGSPPGSPASPTG